MNFMYITLILLLSLIILLFIPIPIKIYIIYNENTLSLKLGNKVFSLDRLKFENINKTSPIEKISKKENNQKLSFKSVLGYLKITPSKPKLKISIYLNYGFEDAYITAISYGIFYSIYPFILGLINSCFTIKKERLHIEPHFNKNIFNFEIKSIFFMSIAKIMYIYIYLLIK
ncbi:DUF2953 domain-containing protein [Clostridium tetani]|uniref:DUF2953 domain-containing protein n=2 Tax=Clostridium tetani TaxID=1513 RepID=Q894L5_CLOTE|nr:hypothetical protein CTC_01526 [Clostridium tetani E88]AVP54099.1 DUF2953 domain-containing protein [Clostridium tetani]QBD85081.1 DUF2953 domain-containing protein [Clostridium tetani]QBD87432.1 DUF2953 domain-containing protein [Clostridium tetani]RXI46039.1 DUF2953 domain-containing protein [Clostridium tetani]